jgi:glucose-6-phosphate isomerase
MLPAINPTKTNAWKALQLHFERIKDVHMNELFANDKDRAKKFSFEMSGLYLDYSKTE